METERKAFCNHRINGVNLKFPNGNELSAIWGGGSYTENHNVDLMSLDKPITGGSDTVEIMPMSKDNKLLARIFRHFKKRANDDSVIGWVTMADWLWVINQLSKPSA